MWTGKKLPTICRSEVSSSSESNNARMVQTANNEQEVNALIRNVAVYLPGDTSSHLRRSNSEVKYIVSNLERSNRLRKNDLHSAVLAQCHLSDIRT